MKVKIIVRDTANVGYGGNIKYELYEKYNIEIEANSEIEIRSIIDKIEEKIIKK